MMMTLPTGTNPADVKRARDLLLGVMDQRAQCILLVFGSGPRPEEIVRLARVRTEGHPARLVVWVPNPAVFAREPPPPAGDARIAAVVQMVEQRAEAGVMTLDSRVSSLLSGARAVDSIELGIAFADAQQGIVLA